MPAQCWQGLRSPAYIDSAMLFYARSAEARISGEVQPMDQAQETAKLPMEEALRRWSDPDRVKTCTVSAPR